MRERFGQFRQRHRVVRDDPALEETDAASSAGVQRPVLVFGLGNPGERYAPTRHNVGQWCVRLLARRHDVQLSRQGKLDLATFELEGTTIEVGRSRTYYNECGPPVAAELRRLRLRPDQLLVVYDEVDLPVGQLRMRKSGSSGGNNGMKSIIAAVGTSEFARIRIGIDRPYDDGVPVRDAERVAGWVLERPGGADRERLDAAVERAVEAIEVAALEGVDIAMNRFNPR